MVGGDGTPLRQFIYADDLATLILRTYLGYKDLDVPRILCPPSSETTIGRVAELIAAAFGITAALRFDPSQPNGQARKTVRAGGRGQAGVLRKGLQVARALLLLLVVVL